MVVSISAADRVDASSLAVAIHLASAKKNP